MPGQAKEQKARILLREGKYREALEEYRWLTGEEPDNPNFHNTLGDIYRALELYQDAIDAYKEAANIYTKDTLFNNAIAICKKILRIDPDDDEIYNILGKLHFELKLDNEAMQNFIEYANRMRRRGRIKEVIKTYEYIKEKNPENEIVENELKELYLQQAIEGAKRLGTLEKTEEPVVPIPEKHLPPLAEAHLEQVIRMLTRHYNLDI